MPGAELARMIVPPKPLQATIPTLESHTSSPRISAELGKIQWDTGTAAAQGWGTQREPRALVENTRGSSKARIKSKELPESLLASL